MKWDGDAIHSEGGEFISLFQFLAEENIKNITFFIIKKTHIFEGKEEQKRYGLDFSLPVFMLAGYLIASTFVQAKYL